MTWTSKWIAGALAAGGLAAGLGVIAGGGAAMVLAAGPVEAQDAVAPADHAAWAARWRARRADEHAAHVRLLHDALGLRPDQAAAFKAFDAAQSPPDMTPHDGSARGAGHHGHEDMAKLTAPERLDRMARRMEEGRARFDRMAAATKAFYAALDPNQRKTFDALHAMRGPHRGRRWGGPRHGGPHGPGPEGATAPPPPGEG